MQEIWFYTIAGVVVVSLVSFMGALTLAIQIDKLKRILLFFVSFAAGALLGDAFIHLLPETFQETQAVFTSSLFILAGIVLFFILEKIIFWRHCHIPTSEDHPHPVGLINLVGDAFHNFIDGVIIAGSFLVNPALGLSTTIAVFLHEIPQEIGDFSILIHAGYSRGKALLFNFLSALTAVLGAVITLIIGVSVQNVAHILVPFTIGGFIYIAAADLIPEIYRERRTGHSFAQLVFFLLGIGVMGLLLLLE